MPRGGQGWSAGLGLRTAWAIERLESPRGRHASGPAADQGCYRAHTPRATVTQVSVLGVTQARATRRREPCLPSLEHDVQTSLDADSEHLTGGAELYEATPQAPGELAKAMWRPRNATWACCALRPRT